MKKEKNGKKVLQQKKKKDPYIPGLSTRPKKSTEFKYLDLDSTKFNTAMCPKNLQEEKEKFMKCGLCPNFTYASNFHEVVNKEMGKDKNKVRTTFFREAKAILDKVLEEQGNGQAYVNTAFGSPIGQEEADAYILEFIRAHDLDGCMTVYWSKTMNARYI